MSKSFRTILPPIDSPVSINHQHRIMSIGSCFAEHISRKLSEHKFNISLNPFGILYNPASINRGINLLIERKEFAPEDLFEHDGLWHSYDHHSKFSKPDRAETLKAINHSLKAAADKEVKRKEPKI